MAVWSMPSSKSSALSAKNETPGSKSQASFLLSNTFPERTILLNLDGKLRFAVVNIAGVLILCIRKMFLFGAICQPPKLVPGESCSLVLPRRPESMGSVKQRHLPCSGGVLGTKKRESGGSPTQKIPPSPMWLRSNGHGSYVVCPSRITLNTGIIRLMMA